MKRKKPYVLVIVAVTVFLFYRYAHIASVSTPRRNVATAYSHTIKAEYGKAINPAPFLRVLSSAERIYISIHSSCGKTTGYSERCWIKVARAIDGDTIELVNGERLRYIGIDTPEEFDSRKPVQCFAKEAAEANRNLVEGKSIIFYKDVSLRDKYGRWLGYVYLEDGTFVNLELVRQGFAFSYPHPPDISKSGEFRVAEAQARKNNAGLWSACAVRQTPAGREQTNGS